MTRANRSWSTPLYRRWWGRFSESSAGALVELHLGCRVSDTAGRHDCQGSSRITFYPKRIAEKDRLLQAVVHQGHGQPPAADQLEHVQHEQRAVHDQAGVALDLARIGLVVMDA